MPQLPHIPNIRVPFSVLVLVHFFFASQVQLSNYFYEWVPSYLFTHLVVILIALWASYQTKGYEPIIAYIVAVAISMLNDIIMLGLYYKEYHDITDEVDVKTKYHNTWHYSAASVIMHLLAKPPCILYALFALFIRYQRAQGGNTDSYQNIGGSDSQQ